MQLRHVLEHLDGARVTPFPAWLGELGRAAIAAAYDDPGEAARYEPDAALVTTRVTNGKGVMPSFKGQLNPQQIADVAAYVSGTAGK